MANGHSADSPEHHETAPVIVAGAGPAGLSAAMALTAAGVPVRILERASVVGGKVYSHRIDGRSVEHGVHGWWTNYLNFDRLLRQAGVDFDEAFELGDHSAVMLLDGSIKEILPSRIDWPSPLFFIPPMLGFRELLTPADMLKSIPFSIHVLAWDIEQDRAGADTISLQELLDKTDFPERLKELGLDAFVRSFDFTGPEKVSAAACLSAIQFYVMPEQRSFMPRWVKGLPQEKIFGPIVDKIKAQGGELSLSTSVQHVRIENGKVVGVDVLGGGESTSDQEIIATVEIDAIPETGFLAVESSSGRIFVGRQPSGFRILSALCPHMGCLVDWEAGDAAFVCPCHGGRFDAGGAVLQGPPVEPLESFDYRLAENRVEVLAEPASNTIDCSAVILATEVTGAQQILEGSEAVPNELMGVVRRLGTSPLAIVIRLWFDRDVPVTHRLESMFSAGGRLFDDFFQINSYNPEIDEEGHVIELQCYECDHLLEASDEELLTRIFEDLPKIDPAYRRDALRHFHIGRHRGSHSLFRPGDNSFRPGQKTAIDGLVLSGDWTQIGVDAWNMERAVIAGIKAANVVLRTRGLPEVAIVHLPEENPLLKLCRQTARVARRLLPSAW